MKNKNVYVAPSIELIELRECDIICSSPGIDLPDISLGLNFEDGEIL